IFMSPPVMGTRPTAKWPEVRTRHGTPCWTLRGAATCDRPPPSSVLLPPLPAGEPRRAERGRLVQPTFPYQAILSAGLQDFPPPFGGGRTFAPRSVPPEDQRDLLSFVSESNPVVLDFLYVEIAETF